MTRVKRIAILYSLFTYLTPFLFTYLQRQHNKFVLENYCNMMFVGQTILDHLHCYKTLINSFMKPLPHLLTVIPSLSEFES